MSACKATKSSISHPLWRVMISPSSICYLSREHLSSRISMLNHRRATNVRVVHLFLSNEPSRTPLSSYCFPSSHSSHWSISIQRPSDHAHTSRLASPASTILLLTTLPRASRNNNATFSALRFSSSLGTIHIAKHALCTFGCNDSVICSLIVCAILEVDINFGECSCRKYTIEALHTISEVRQLDLYYRKAGRKIVLDKLEGSGRIRRQIHPRGSWKSSKIADSTVLFRVDNFPCNKIYERKIPTPVQM